MKKYYLFGGSGHGKVVADILQSCNIAVTSVLDDHPTVSTLLSIPIIPSKAYMAGVDDEFIIAIGNNRSRKQIAEKYSFSY